MGPSLDELGIVGEADAWTGIGFVASDVESRLLTRFELENAAIIIERNRGVSATVSPPRRGEAADDFWLGLARHVDDGATGAPIEHSGLDGLPVRPSSGRLHRADTRERLLSHPNGITRLDHVVIATPDVPRTLEAFSGVGWELRRQRPTWIGEVASTQSFFWAGDVIVELVGPDAAAGDGPSTLWGMALVSADIDASVEWLGPTRCRPPSPALQGGRRIATVLTGELGITTRMALMSPHDPNAVSSNLGRSPEKLF